MNQNYTPLTEETRKLFSQLVDVNWEIKLQEESEDRSEEYYRDLLELRIRYKRIEGDIIKLMGHDEFENFLKMGARMFAE
jgi:hypothetical protein